MQISVESLEGLQRKMTIVVPVDDVKKAYEARLEKVSKNARIDGFRPGKVPAQVLDKKFGSSVLNEVAGELVQQTLQKAIEEKELRIAGMPSVDFKNLKKNEPLEYAATFDVYPDISLNELNGAEIERTTAEITDKDIDNMVEKIRKQHAE
ncbi:MAG: hypothetical protein K0U23_08820 [Gammaproteobacteria bacterium]|nr:hypothetical protein [Gammaproteobacteria bacterium]